jgi:hypothetical protein
MSAGDFERMFPAAVRQMEEAARRGLAKAGMRLVRDAVMEVPKVPYEEGTLRGSGSVFVSGKLVDTTQNMDPGGTPATVLNEPVSANTLEAVVGYNTPYAAYQHEGIRQDGTHEVKNYTEPGAGAKFLERKMSENRDDYMAIIAHEIKRGGGPGGPVGAATVL